MQTKTDLEKWYTDRDPWQYESYEDDTIRKQIILSLLEDYGQFESAIDIGAGEGFITKDLPASNIYAIEISDNAAERLPDSVQRVNFSCRKKFDLVIATGVFYMQYDHEEMKEFIERCVRENAVILTSHIKDWEIPLQGFTQVHTQEFPYREYTQKLRIFKNETSA